MQVTGWIIPTCIAVVPGSPGRDQDPVVLDAVQAQEKLCTVSAALTEDQSVLQKEENVFLRLQFIKVWP